MIESDSDDLRKLHEQFEAAAEAAHNEIEGRLASEVQRLSEALEAKTKTLTERLQQSTTSLDDKKADRSNLADLLTSLANKLQADR